MASQILEKALEMASGEPIERLRNLDIAEVRKIAEKKHGSRFSVKSWWPFVGRGTVMRDNVVTHAEVEATFDAAVRKC